MKGTVTLWEPMVVLKLTLGDEVLVEYPGALLEGMQEAEYKY